MDDAAAIKKCKAGDNEAFRYIVERYQAEAIGHAAAILGSRDDALDAVQDAFIDAFRGVGQIDLTRPFYPWFYVVLRNRCYKQAAGGKKREAGSTDDLVILAPTPSIRPEETLLLEQSMLELKDAERELLTLKHMDGLSYEELAERFDVPIGTIMSRLYHARKRLREKLSRRSFTGLRN